MPPIQRKYVFPSGQITIQIDDTDSDENNVILFSNKKAENTDVQKEKSTKEACKTHKDFDNRGVETALKDIADEKVFRKAEFSKLIDEHVELVEEIKKMEMKISSKLSR